MNFSGKLTTVLLLVVFAAQGKTQRAVDTKRKKSAVLALWLGHCHFTYSIARYKKMYLTLPISPQASFELLWNENKLPLLPFRRQSQHDSIQKAIKLYFMNLPSCTFAY